MLTCSDQVQIFSFDLIHHGIHLCETHNTCYNIASDHERWYTVSKSTIDHKVSCICKYRRMNSCDITHQIIESISRYSSGALKIDSVKCFHDLCMVWNLEIRNKRLTEFFNFYILTVIFSDWYRRIDDVRNDHHILFQFLFYFFFFFGKFFDSCSTLSYFSL